MVNRLTRQFQRYSLSIAEKLLGKAAQEVVPVGFRSNACTGAFFGALFTTIIWVLVSLLVGMTALGTTKAFAEGDPAFIRFGVGYFDINDDQDAGELHFEYISDSKLWYFTPQVGLMATTDAAAYLYGGLRLDLFLGRRFVFTPQFSAGLYHDGDGKDLGHAVEFRSALELAYRFDDRSRVGVSLYHLSNGSLSDDNPGAEAVSLHYSVPLTGLFNTD